MAVVYHWRHGWIPLDHTAALEKAKGNHKLAANMLHDAPHGRGIQTRQDMAKAVLELPHVPSSHRQDARKQVMQAADRLNAHDLVPGSHRKSKIAPLDAGVVNDLRGGSGEKHLETDANGVTRFSPERAALHDHIINNILGDHRGQSKPSFVLLGGGPASGKTKAEKAANRDFPDAVTVNADHIKEMLPEFDHLKERNPNEAASFTHEESSYLAKRAVAEGLKRRANIVLDGVGNNSVESVRKKISQARSHGYEVHARYVTIPTDEAQRRAFIRGQKSRRVVPREVIAHAHAGVSDVFPQIMHEVDTAELHDNTTEWTRVASKSRGGKAVIHDKGLWQGFRSKAHPPAR